MKEEKNIFKIKKNSLLTAYFFKYIIIHFNY